MSVSIFTTFMLSAIVSSLSPNTNNPETTASHRIEVRSHVPGCIQVDGEHRESLILELHEPNIASSAQGSQRFTTVQLADGSTYYKGAFTLKAQCPSEKKTYNIEVCDGEAIVSKMSED